MADTPNSEKTLIEDAKAALVRFSQLCKKLDDGQVPEVFGEGRADALLVSLLNQKAVSTFPSIGDFLLANRNRAGLIAQIRHVMTQNYSFSAKVDGKVGYASPSHIQWFEDGIIITEGEKRFEGSLAVYRKDSLKYAVAKRDAVAGESLSKDDFEWVDLDTTREMIERQQVLLRSKTEQPLQELRHLLETQSSSESKFQELLERFPWSIGLQFETVQRHLALDDRNIPDFTAVRVRDGSRDIVEIKPPSMPVFRQDGEFSAEFNSAWNQAERYLAFARRETDYLRRKGLRFDNPKCFLICGYRLNPESIAKLRIKEEMNPSLQILTFNEVERVMEQTINFIRDRLSAQSQVGTASSNDSTK